MLVKTDGRTIEVFVGHSRPFVTKYKSAVNLPDKYSGLTEVVLSYDEDFRRVSLTGRSYCLKPDNFCKTTGLRIALTRALQHSTLTKTERTAIWKKLWNDKFTKRGTTSSKTPTSGANPTASPDESSPTTHTEPPTRL